MRTRRLHHGTDGDSILSILRSGEIQPGPGGEIFFAEHEWQHALAHGGDRKRKAAFVITLRIACPDTVEERRRATPGVPDTLILVTEKPLSAKVLELHVRRPGEGGFEVTEHQGETDIRRALESRGR